MENKTKAYDDNICGAKTRAGTPCKQKAGWGTNHVGEGRCKLHGGLSTGPKDRRKQSKSQQKNNNAEKHGLFSKYLPKETMDLVNSIETLDPIDILWDNIKIQYGAIIRSQKIMYVRDKEDDDKPTLNGEVLTASTKQSDFLQSQSRAMTTLTRMIKEYEGLCEAGMATEQQRQRVEQIKANTELTKERTKLMKGTKKDTSILEALIDLGDSDE